MLFWEKMERMERTISRSVKNIRYRMQQFKKSVDEEHNGSYLERIEYMKNLMEDLASLLRPINGYDFQQEAVKLWQERGISIFSIIDKTPDFWERDVSLGYSENMDENLINLAKDMIVTANKLYPGIENDIKGRQLEQKKREDIETKINTLLQLCGKGWAQERDRLYIQALYELCVFLDKIGGLKSYLKRYNSIVMELGIEGIELDYEQRKGKGLLNRVADLSNRDVIEKLELYKKKLLLAFYSNRATKEVEQLMVMYFIFNKVGDVQTAIKLDDETLRRLILEVKFLGIVWKKRLEEDRQKLEKNLTISEEDLLTKSVEELSEGTIESDVWEKGIDIKEFEKYFGQNSFEQDKEIIIPFSITLNRMYALKDGSMETLIYMILKESKGLNIRNWGYIPESNKKGQNSIESEQDNILIGVDFPQFNMPVRLHINRQWLLRIVQSFGNTKIPVYKGQEDFFINSSNGTGKYVGTQILMPFQKEQRKILERAVGEQISNPHYQLITHLNWLAYPNRIPEHLKN